MKGKNEFSNFGAFPSEGTVSRGGFFPGRVGVRSAQTRFTVSTNHLRQY